MSAECRDRFLVAPGCLVALILHFSLLATTARGEIVPPRGAVDSRIRTALYDGEQVYRLRGFVGYQIDLEFEMGESFVGLAAGDIEGLACFGEDNNLFLTPKAPKVPTKLTVLPSRRHDHFEYTAIAQRPGVDDQDVTFALRFTYQPVQS